MVFGVFFLTVVLPLFFIPIWIQKDACGPHNPALQFGTLGVSGNLLVETLTANFQPITAKERYFETKKRLVPMRFLASSY